MTAITFRTNDAGKWGTGAGANLTASQVDNNFWNLKTAVEALQDNPPEAVSVDGITQAGNTITFSLTDGTTQGPFTLPAAEILFRGDWTPSTAYAVGDIVSSGGALYIVLTAHTSASTTFDPGANDGSGADYYDQILGTSLPVGGTTGQRLVKASNTDGDIEWASEPVPTGGTTGQLLAKASSTDRDLEFIDPPVAVPAGGTTGQVLSKASNTDGDVEWADASGGGSSLEGMMVGGIGVVSHAGTANFSFSSFVTRYDTGAAFQMHASITGALQVGTLPAGALGVRVGCTIYASATAGNVFYASIQKNGSSDYSAQCPGASAVVGDDGYVRINLASGPIQASSGDYFTVFCYCMNPSTLDYSSWTEQPNETNFWINAE